MVPAYPTGHCTERPGRGWLPALGLGLAVLLAYGPSLHAPFLFDDAGAVTQNPTIRHLASLTVLQPPADGSTTTGRPLVNLTFALNWAWSGDRAWSYHAVNIAIHLGAALALLGLVRRALTGPVLGPRCRPVAEPISWLTALLWALHPLQTESVTCIAQRTESLCGFFYLLTLYAFARCADGHGQSDADSGHGRRSWAVCAVLACGAGMATKEVMVTAPLVVLLYDRTFVVGSFAAAWRARRGTYLALAATWGVLAVLVAGGGGSRGAAAGLGLGVSTGHYLLQQCEALVRYGQLTLWPHPLVLDYGSGVVTSPADVWWQGLLVLAALAGTGWALVRKPVAGFIGASCFLFLAPSSSFVPLVTQTMAEHRMYLPLASLGAAAVAGGVLRFGRPAVWAGGAIAAGFAAATLVRNHDYRDAIAIWSSSVAAFPTSARAHNNLAQALQEAQRPAEARAHFARAIALDPQYVSAHYNWGVALLAQGREAEAAAQLETAVRLAPAHVDARVNLGNALVRLQRSADAVPHYEHALRAGPSADIHFNLGVALADLGRAAAAAAQLHSALALNPRLPEAHFQLGRLAERASRLDEAAAEFASALRIDPDHLGAHRRLGLLLARRNDLPAAAAHFRALLRLAPADVEAHANLGNVLLLQGQGREAIAHFEAALRLRPGDARLQESLRLARDAAR